MSQMRLDALKQNLTSPQRGYLWEFEIPSPRGIGDSDVWILRAQSMTEPGRSFAVIDIPFKGTGGIRVPGKETYSHEITVTLLESEDAKTYEAIQSWMKLIRDNVNGTGLADPDLKSDSVLTLLNNQGTPVKRIKLVGMYPQNKADVKLDYGTSEAMKYDLTFAYDRWEEMSL
jgi:hypothetical protein